jgi:hypothetical protein
VQTDLRRSSKTWKLVSIVATIVKEPEAGTAPESEEAEVEW